MASPRNPSAAYTRFKTSMNLDYDAWRDGARYDITALAEVTAEERDLLSDEICAKPALDWRDVEALQVLATRKALKRIGEAARTQTDSAGILAFADEAAQGWSPAIETRFIEKLKRAELSALDRLYDIAEAHATQAVVAQLLECARSHEDPTVRYSMGAFLVELTGHADSRYTFDPGIRSHLLDLNAVGPARAAALAWLEQKVASPIRPGFPGS